MRACTSCKAEKPESEFHRFGKDDSRVGKWCKDCYAKNKKKPSKKRPLTGSATT